MLNAMSIDLEDWFCVHNLSAVIKKAECDRCELRIVDNTRRLLETLARHRVQATFFVLGWVAERVPDLIREISRCGHEIASHGYSHTLITDMTPASFEQDVKQSLRTIGQCVD